VCVPSKLIAARTLELWIGTVSEKEEEKIGKGTHVEAIGCCVENRCEPSCSDSSALLNTIIWNFIFSVPPRNHRERR